MRNFLTILLIPFFTFLSSPSYAYEDPQETIILASDDTAYITGPIGPRNEEYFMSLDFNKIRRVVLDSGGGKLRVAIRMAAKIRNHKLETVVLANKICYSACVLLFQAGTLRTADVTAGFMVHYAFNRVGKNRDTLIIDTNGSWLYFRRLLVYDIDPRLIERVILKKDDGGDVFFTAIVGMQFNVVNHITFNLGRR